MKKLLILIILVIVLVGCRKVEDEVKWDNIPMFMYKDDFYYYKKHLKKNHQKTLRMTVNLRVRFL